MKKCTLLFLLKDNEILLAMKKRGFGMGKWNGIGGKVEPGESFTEAAIRECQEEIEVTPVRPTKLGDIYFYLTDDPDFNNHVHIFAASQWEGEPHETDEMRPQWFKEDTIPFDQMWGGDYLWLPLLLAGKRFTGKFTLDNNTVVQHDIKEVTNFRE